MKINLSEQVAGFVGRLAPAPRRELRLALKSPAKGRGDVKALEGPLSGYWRLRVSSYRVILFYRSPKEVTLKLVSAGFYDWIFQNRNDKQSALKTIDPDSVPGHPKIPDEVLR